MLEGHRTLARLESSWERTAVHDLVHWRRQAQRCARKHSRSNNCGGHTLRRRTGIVHFVAVFAVEVLLEHQLAVAHDDQRMTLRRVDRIHRQNSEVLNGLLDAGSGPAVVKSRRCAVDVACGTLPARIESTKAVLIAPEIVTPATRRKT